MDFRQFSTITRVLDVQGGQACIRGRRYRVCDFLMQLANGYSDGVENIAEDFDLDPNDLKVFLIELAFFFENERLSR